MKKYSLPIVISTVVAFLFSVIYAYGATTISTNITTGGTLTVSGATTLSSTLAVTGASTLTADLTVNTNVLKVDATNDRVGVGTATPSALFSVGAGAGTFEGDAYFTGGLTVGASTTINSIEGSILFPNSQAADPTSGLQEGLLYYNSSSKLMRLYDGSNWTNVATSSTGSGFAASGKRIQFNDSTNFSEYLTLGTTTQRGLSILTLTATTTNTIPLTIRAEASQTANLMQVQNILGTELFAFDALGHASSTGGWDFTSFVNFGDATGADEISVTGNGFLTIGTTTETGLSMLTLSASTTASIPLTLKAEDSQTANIFQVHNIAGTELFAIDALGHASSTGEWTIDGLASTTQLRVGGASGGTISNMVFGTCQLANTSVTASTTVSASCTGATGIEVGHNVFVSATGSLHGDFSIVAASSSAEDTIALYIYNNGSTGTTTTATTSTLDGGGGTCLSFFGIE